MPGLNRLSAIGPMLALVLLASACRPVVRQPSAPPEERFAREFLRVLQDSGAAAILPRTTPRTRALRNYAQNMDVLRGELAASTAPLTFVRWSAVPPKGDIPRLVRIDYTFQRADGPVGLSLWIEQASGYYLLNTISIGAP